MHPAVGKMLILQEIDSEIHKLEKDLKEYPGRREVRVKDVERVESRLDEAREQRKSLEVQVRDAESRVREFRTILDKFKIQLHSVKNQKEYDALTHEIEEGERRISDVDEAGLERLEEEERLDARIVEYEKSLEIKRNECEVETRRLTEREEAKTRQLADCKARRGAAAEGIDAQVLHRYTRLFERLPGSCVAPLRGDTCGGCHIPLVPHRIQALRNDDVLNECDSCHRFLYAEETEGAEESESS